MSLTDGAACTQSTCCESQSGELEWWYTCRECGFRTCWLHSYLGEDRAWRCYRCCGDATVVHGEAPRLAVYGQKRYERERYVLVVLHALHVSGTARCCLEAVRELQHSNVGVCVLALGGGGHWADRFLEAADVVAVTSSRDIRWDDLGGAVDMAFEVACAHYDPAIEWLMRVAPSSVSLQAYFHTAPLNADAVRRQISLCRKREAHTYFPCEETLHSYQRIAGDTWPIDVGVAELTLPQEITRGTSGHGFTMTRSTSRNHVAVVSRVDADKMSTDLLLDTAKALRDMCAGLKIVVAGPGEELRDLRLAVRQAGLSSVIDLLGYVDRIAAVYNWANVVFLPSWTECRPYAAIEAGAFGLRCVMPALGVAADPKSVPMNVDVFSPGDASEAAQLLATVLRGGGPDERPVASHGSMVVPT